MKDIERLLNETIDRLTEAESYEDRDYFTKVRNVLSALHGIGTVSFIDEVDDIMSTADVIGSAVDELQDKIGTMQNAARVMTEVNDKIANAF